MTDECLQGLVDGRIERRSLVRPIEGILDSQRGLFMLLAGDATNAFRDWLLSDIGQQPLPVRQA